MIASRLLLRRLALSTHSQSNSLGTRPSGFLPLVSQFLQTSNTARAALQPCVLRTYATTGGRPKKGTRQSTKKPAATKPAPKTKPKAKKKSAKKPAKKPAKKRTTKKPTPGQEITAKVRALRQVALLDEPKKRPTTVWTLYNQTHVVKGVKATDRVRQNSRAYRSLSVTDRESLNQTAINNRALNARTYSDWIRSHTPDQVRLANNARTRLNRLSTQRTQSNRRYTKRHLLLKDDRQLKRPASGYMQYMADRWATGDFVGYKVADASKAMTEEWKNLPEADKKQYNDAAQTRKETYLTESAELYPSIAEKQQKARSRAKQRNARDRSETLGR